jgi:hypothetical protein
MLLVVGEERRVVEDVKEDQMERWRNTVVVVVSVGERMVVDDIVWADHHKIYAPL